MIKKIFFVLFPKFLWLALGISIFLGLNDNLRILSVTVSNIVFLFIFLRLGIIIHEIGHLVAAKLVGGIPRRIILGLGHEVNRFYCFGTKIVVNSNFKGGFALANFNQKTFIKSRRFVNVAGGPMMNLILAYMFFVIFSFDFRFLSGKNGIDLSSTFIVSNILLGIMSLVPYYINYQGIRIPTDGLTLIKLPFQKIEKLKEDINHNDFFDALEFIETKEYSKAQNIYEKYVKIESTAFASKLNLGIVFLKKGEIEKSNRMYLDCLEALKNEKLKNYKALVHNNLAWLCLLKQDYKNADYHSKVSYSINQKENNFKGTRGAALIENGKIKQGIKILDPLVDFKYPNSQTLCASMYLSFAHFLLDKEESKYSKFVQDNLEELDKDEKLLWDRIHKRMHES